MAKGDYLVEVNGKMSLRDIKGMTKHIRAIQDRVEKSTDSYKKCMEEVWLIKKYKGNRESGLSFSDFMYLETGMSKAMCYRLCQLWDHRLRIEGFCEDKCSYGDSSIDLVLSAFDSLSMKSMLNDMKYDIMLQTVEEMDSVILDGTTTRDEILEHYYAKELEKIKEFLLEKQEAATIESKEKEEQVTIDEEQVTLDEEESTLLDNVASYTVSSVDELADVYSEIEDAINNGVKIKYIITIK